MPRPPSHYVFFWKPTETYGWASQWWKSPFTESTPEGSKVDFQTAEHYMMYHKAILFDDLDIAQQVLTAPHPADVKKLGQRVQNFNDQKWNANRSKIVRDGNFLKFTQNEDLAALLLSTGDKILVEASPFDRIWGIGYTEEKAMANKDHWGLNLLGEALMDVRKQLQGKED